MRTDPTLQRDDERVAPGHGRLGRAHHRWEERMYARLGPRYVLLQAAMAVTTLHLISLGASLVLALYVDVSPSEFLTLVIASQGGWALTDVVLWSTVRRRARPLERWLAERDPADRRNALAVAQTLPSVWLRSPASLAVLLVAALAVDVLALRILDFDASGGLALFGGSLVALAYWAMFAFLLLEHGLRPVLDDLDAGDPAASVASRIALGTRLLVALPAINVITGVVVAGVVTGRDGGAGDLAVGIGAALAVSAAVSSWLTALLSDSVVTPIAALQNAARRVGGGDLTTRVAATGADETAELAREFNRMVHGLQQRERLRHAFGAYVDPLLAERVAADGVDLAGDEVDASIMFVDVRGFTSFAERAPAHAVVARLNDLFECLVPIVLDHGGHANKFIGDGLLAVFGAPDRRPDHADRAVAAACAVAAEVRRRYGDALRVGVGVNTGRVVTGTIGGGGRLDFTVIGDAVNTASRVEAATRVTGDDMLITEATRRALTIQDGWAERPPIELKGKHDRVRLYAPA